MKLTPEEIERKVNQIVRGIKYDGYLKSQVWKNKRYAKLVDVNFICEGCGYGKYDFEDQPLDVHHKTYERFGNERMSDLEVLCRTCHEERHGRKF